jgi:hypothetical protein
MTNLENETAPAASAAEDSSENATERFQAHAAARLRGDTAEAARIASQFTERERRTHMIFVQSLFAGVVIDALGTRPDPSDLAEVAKRLHDKHFQPDTSTGAAFVALRAEAMIRALFGEEFLLFEIPFGEQPGYMWAVMAELCGTELTDDRLAEHFRAAAEIARDGIDGAAETITGSFAETFAETSVPAAPDVGANADTGSEPNPEPEPDSDSDSDSESEETK